MDDYIKRKDIYDHFIALYKTANICGFVVTGDIVLKSIEYAIAEDVKPVIHARWIECGDNQPMSNDKVYCCSNCNKGKRLFNFIPYCAYCGAEMENWNDE